MNVSRRTLMTATAIVTAAAFGGYWLTREPLALSRDLMVGEVSQDRALVQFRLSRSGSARLEIADNAEFIGATSLGERIAAAENDFIVRYELTGLRPHRDYFVRVVFGADEHVTSTRFRTLPADDEATDIHIVALGCLNYSAFYTKARKGYSLYQGEDAPLGFPGLAVAADLAPDYLFCLGDNIYYDTEPFAETVEDMRRKWQEVADLPRYRTLFREIPAYWVKDDHDYRYNDSDPYMDMPVSHEDGVAVFREQVPVVPQGDRTTPTYRTIRFGADLQVWFLENRDYRSANHDPDGPDKTLWGLEQREWLKSTLLASDARFLIIASPNPIIGPERNTKRDNQVTEIGFKTEGEAFLQWLADNGLVSPRLVIVTSDMHYPYHSRHPLGIDELGTGTLTEGNFYTPPPPEKTSDPDGLLTYLYQGWEEVATLLDIRLGDGASGLRRLELRHVDTGGREIYAFTFYSQGTAAA